jgi:hypothetical protein
LTGDGTFTSTDGVVPNDSASFTAGSVIRVLYSSRKVRVKEGDFENDQLMTTLSFLKPNPDKKVCKRDPANTDPDQMGCLVHDNNELCDARYWIVICSFPITVIINQTIFPGLLAFYLTKLIYFYKCVNTKLLYCCSCVNAVRGHSNLHQAATGRI